MDVSRTSHKVKFWKSNSIGTANFVHPWLMCNLARLQKGWMMRDTR